MSRSLVLFLVLLTPAWASAQPDTPEPTKVASVEGVTEYQLDNGARVVLFPEASQPTITVNMTVMVGSRHEGYGEAGMAHLLEHMVFKGTPTFEDVPRALRDHGARFNGTTNRDRTNYFETLPATDENLEFAIQLEADRLVNSYVAHEDLISEFTVVRNEFERGENSPQGVLRQRVMAAAFEWHNYGKTTIGNRSDIERVPIDNLQAFYRKYYQPDNVVLVITGRFEESRALELVNKYLGSIPRPDRKLDATYTEEPPQDGERYVELKRVGKIGSITAAYHMPAASHEDWAPLSMLASVMSEDKVGLLEQKLVESDLASSVSARSDNAHDPGLFFVSLQPTEGNLEAAKATLLETMDDLGQELFTAAAVDRAKTRAMRRSENLTIDANAMAQALSSASAAGDWRLLFLQRDRVAEVSAEDVNRVAKKYFPPHNRTVGVFLPTDEAQRMLIPVVASIADVVKDYKGGEAVAAGEAFDPTPENLDARINFANIDGVQVALLPKQTTGETVNLTMTLRYGNEQSLQDNTTAAGFIPSMLMAGTQNMDRQALQERMAAIGVRIFPGSGGGRRGGRRGGGSRGGSAGQLSFSIQAKRSSLGEAIQLVGEIMREPAFPEEEFERMKTRMVDGMKSRMTDPQMLARNDMSRAMSRYESDDVRYVPTLDETIERIDNLTLEQVKQVYQNQLSSATGQIAIVGDFDQQATLAALAEILGDWKSDVEFASIDREALDDVTGSNSDIVTPDKANAVFMAGLPLPLNDADDDAEALRLGNFILGGGSLSSRLGDRIRQKEGLSYGVSSSIAIPTRGNDARFTINAITNPENIDAVESAAMEELTRFIEEGPTDEEVETAQVAWLESQKVSRSRDGSIAGQMSSNLYLDRTFEHTSERERKIAELTHQDIKEAFRRHIDPAKLVIIRAGDFKE
ncbi:MAG: M16 family metallopeptidase [Pirellulaceae bacterium]